jgi:LysM repeat protein
MDYGIDVSHYNAISDANAVRANGITYAWCKASQTLTEDPTFAAKVNQLRAAGIVVGAYCFLTGSASVAAQAAYFRQVAGDSGCLSKGALLPMMDMEDASVRANANSIVPSFFDAIGVEPQDVYGNLDWWNNALKPGDWGSRDIIGHIARYNGNPGNPGFSYPRMGVHQHSDAGVVPGIPGNVDRDATMPGFALAQLCIGGVAVASPPVVSPPPAPVNTGDTWVVKSGDTLSRIASQWGVTVSALAATNGISNPDLIHVGQIIHRPGSTGAAPAPTASGATYVVRSGDTLSGIASLHGTSVAVLVALNHIANPDRIQVGQVITLPTAGPATPPAARVYVVQPGDTLGKIAAKLAYPGGYVALAARNGISNPNLIKVGEQIHY